MVVMFFPATLAAGVEQARIGSPSASTVQAPHKRHAATELGPGEAQRIAQHPEQRRVRIHVGAAFLAVDSQSDALMREALLAFC